MKQQTISKATLRTLARHGFLSVNGVELLQNGKEMPRSAPHLERSADDWTKSFKPWFFWQLHCSHERMFCLPCNACKRLGVTQTERDRRYLLAYNEVRGAGATPRQAVEIFVATLGA